MNKENNNDYYLILIKYIFFCFCIFQFFLFYKKIKYLENKNFKYIGEIMILKHEIRKMKNN